MAEWGTGNRLPLGPAEDSMLDPARRVRNSAGAGGPSRNTALTTAPRADKWIRLAAIQPFI